MDHGILTIREHRQARKLTQAQLAERIGVQYQTVSKWENGITMPDVLTLPRIADVLDITMDELFGRKQLGCSGEIPEDERLFLLNTYAQMYGPEAGPWNLSVGNKYLEYRFADFFERHFTVTEGMDLCNIGIGAGEWDRYLSYKLKNGSLTSIDRLEICCRQLEKRLVCEGNPNKVTVICSDVMELESKEQFDIVTMVGTTGMESGDSISLLEKASHLVKTGGSIYYQTLDEKEDCNHVFHLAHRLGLQIGAYEEDRAYGFCARYYQLKCGVSVT